MNKLKLKKTESSVYNDRATFDKWENYEIATEEAKKRIAKSNEIDELSDEQFLELTKMCGYHRASR